MLEKNLSQSLSISGKNSFKIHKINLNYIDNYQNNLSEINNHDIFKNNQVLSENNAKLPQVYKKKNYFSENIYPKKEKKNCNCLYLKYEGNEDDIDEMKKKIYIEIYPDKIFRSLRHIIKKNENLINNLEKTINKIKVDKYTTMTNLNGNLTTDFKTIDVDYNEILNNAENNYILLTQNNNNSNKRLFKIKNVFLENIIKNVVTHTVEIRNKKNQIMLKEDLEDELNNQLDLLKKFFMKALNSQKQKKISKDSDKIDIKNTQFIKIKKHLLKTYNQLFFHNLDETENFINSIINKRTEGYLTERNKRNMEIFNIFKKQLGMRKYQSIHTLYNNIVSNKNNFLQNNIKLEDKRTNTENELNKNKKMNNNLKNKKLNVLKFCENYREIKDDLNLNNKKGNNNKYIFDLSPNLKIVEFDEISEEINEININKRKEINKSVNNEKLFFKMVSRTNVLNKVNFNHLKNKNIYKLFIDDNNEKNVFRKKIFINPKKASDILKKLGEKLHKKINIKIGRNKKKIRLDSSFDSNKTEYFRKRKKEKYSKNGLLTEDKQISIETNSSIYSDIPSDFSMSFSEIKREKEEKSKKIKEIIQNKDMLNEYNILDIDELFFNVKKTKNKGENIIKKEESKEFDNKKEKELENRNEDKMNYNEKENKIIEDNKKIDYKKKINKENFMTNILIKNKIKKRPIKYIHINDNKEKIISKNSHNSVTLNKSLTNKDKPNLINPQINSYQMKLLIKRMLIH